MARNKRLSEVSVKFGQGQDPTKGGRKPSRFNEVLSIMGLSGEVVLISKEDKYKLIEMLLEMTADDLEKVINNSKTPIFIMNMAKAIMTDVSEGKTTTLQLLFDRFFGRANQVITGGTNDDGTNNPIHITLNLGKEI